MSVARFKPLHAATFAVAAAITQAVATPANAQPEPAAVATPAVAATVNFDIPAQDLSAALSEFARQSGQQLLYAPDIVAGRRAPAVSGPLSPLQALDQLLEGTGLPHSLTPSGAILIGENGASGPKTEGSAGSDGAAAVDPADVDPGVSTPGESTTSSVEMARRGGIEEIIVTGQKKEERLQDVPIAISAFSMDQLDNQKIEGGFDLLKAVPNVTFSKTNFSGYNFQIRGIGTQAISATTDPGVAVSFNNTTLIVNRLFEQEYLDIERVEVLRGPQGTLYGRNATAGVINVIPARPEMGVHGGELKLETGNYNAQRLRGHYNIPLNDDSLALRIAYASTVRDGYVTNEFDGQPIDGRDLSTARISLGWQPTDRFSANFSWERFDENDDRLRSAKNLCRRDPGLDQIGDLNVDDSPFPVSVRRTAQQGCLPVSLYSDEAFQVPNGDAAPFITAGRYTSSRYLFYWAVAGSITQPVLPFPVGTDPSLLTEIDVFESKVQSRDLRSVYSPIDPVYRASADLFDLTLSYAWSDGLQLTSYTVFNDDSVFSTQDFTRYPAAEGLFSEISGQDYLPKWQNFTPGGVFCDPQLGCSSAFLAQDISQAESRQFNQQFELVSDFDGLWNFSMGVNFTRFETTADYFFFSNALTALAQMPPFDGNLHPCTNENKGCVSIQQEGLMETAANPYGHNFFLSRNPYKLTSAGVFGESYWQLTPSLKLTAGLRFTWDRKVFTPTPSQTLLADYREAELSLGGQGTPAVPDPEFGPERCRTSPLCKILGNAPGGRGYPTDPDIIQTWREPTGRLILDWITDLPFTDETLVYASYARGYKGGGANPPSIAQPAGFFIERAQGAVSSRTFEPEYVNAYELGTKNTLFGGAMTVNAAAFYYDYEGYQVSKIVDRSAVNDNFDAAIWGAELELMLAPTPEWVSNVAVGYLRTRIADGEQAIDLMDRAQGGQQFFITELPNPNYDPDAPQVAREDYVAARCESTGLATDVNCSQPPAGQAFLAFDEWIVVKPMEAQASNCIAPAELVKAMLGSNLAGNELSARNIINGFCPAGILSDQILTPLDYRADFAPNGGAGFFDDLSGHELPNAPRFTVSLGTQYTFHLPAAWDLTSRVDWYWQDQSFARVHNTEYDQLRAWSSTNLSLWAEKVDWGLRIEAYVKNVFDDAPITGAFLNSDDTGLTTNIFTLDPRLVGVSITKRF